MEMSQSGAPVGTTSAPSRLVGISYFFFFVIMAMLFTHLCAAVLVLLKMQDAMLLGVAKMTTSVTVGTVIALALTIYLWVNVKVRTLATEIGVELQKVTWPTFPEVRVSTVAVVITSFVAAAILFFFDVLSSNLITKWVPGLLEWLRRV